jgi:hypothetical protein
MTIVAGQTIQAADLKALVATATTGLLPVVQNDASQRPIGQYITFTFPGITNAASSTRCKSVFIAPCDMLLLSVAVAGHETENAKTFTATVQTNFDVAENFDVEITGTASSGGTTTHATRLLYDNTIGKGGTNIVNNRVVRVLLAGSAITVQASTTSTTSSTVTVTLCVLEWFQR